MLFVLPPHCSHILQPLDIGCFSPMKAKYSQECQMYMRENPGRQVTKYDICSLACKAYSKGFSSTNLVSTFRKAGIVPLDRGVITAEKLAPSTILANATSEEEEQGTSTEEQGTSTEEPNDSNNSNIGKPSPEKNAQTFLETKLPSVVKSRKSCKRKSTLKYGGREITSDEFYADVQSETTSKKPKASTSKGKKASDKAIVSESQTAGPSCIPVDSETSTENSDSEPPKVVRVEDLCCQCKKWQPDAMNLDFALEIVNWVQCDICSHWCHLKFCTPERVIRRNAQFACPCCK